VSKETVGTTHAVSQSGDEIETHAEDDGLYGLEGGTKMQLRGARAQPQMKLSKAQPQVHS